MRLIDADALEKEMCSGCEYSKSKYANCDDCAIANAPTVDAVQVSEDTQTEERARLVAKETELAHIEARLENAEKRLQELPKYTNCTGFIEWLTEVVLNDKDWELNAVAYGEVICRKLVKLGVLEVTEEPSYYIRPSALQAEPVKHGEWKVYEMHTTQYGEVGFECSVCGVPYRLKHRLGAAVGWHYCPTCGAKNR